MLFLAERYRTAYGFSIWLLGLQFC